MAGRLGGKDGRRGIEINLQGERGREDAVINIFYFFLRYTITI